MLAISSTFPLQSSITGPAWAATPRPLPALSSASILLDPSARSILIVRQLLEVFHEVLLVMCKSAFRSSFALAKAVELTHLRLEPLRDPQLAHTMCEVARGDVAAALVFKPQTQACASEVWLLTDLILAVCERTLPASLAQSFQKEPAHLRL